ncbi:MAG: PEGA domain-containing protein, partial [Acidobacteria bacterium]|nr:PEGA domain-containing protein [Acidobacteriota bacterium]MCA1652216.1 PEGA domain-containing protein [Acidobacteriota bacterium]
PPDQGPPRGQDPEAREGQRSATSGAVAIRVQPADAEISIDGERWEAPQGGERLIVQLDEGEHRVEISKDGYRPFSTTVRVRRGETAPLNVSLTRQDKQ